MMLAGLRARSDQIEFDEEVAFSTQQRLFGIARDGDARPGLTVVSMSHPPALRQPRVCAMDEQKVTEAQVRAACRAYWRLRL